MTAHFVKRPATTDDIVKAVDTLGFAVDRRLSVVEDGQKTLVADVAVLKTDVAELKTDVADLKQGQQVLMENQLALKSEMTDVKRGVEAIMAHFKIPDVS